MRKTIVVSGINLYEGGTLRVYYNFCDEIIQKQLYKQIDFVLFVHKLSLFDKYRSYFEIIELPDSRTSWLKRLKYEYIYFEKYSKDKQIDLWISIHDMTPRVHAKHQITYFHNPTFAHKPTLEDFKYNKKIFLFSLFYKYLYKINVHSNDFVIVQQDWIANSISEILKLDQSKIAVMPAENNSIKCEKNSKKMTPYMFFFPSVCRHFKNFEIICEATRLLDEKGYGEDFQVFLTIDGTENQYGKEIVEKYKHINNIHFCGYLNMEEIFEYYQKSSCLIFPSKMETWGLPISEAKQFHLPLLVVDLPYAHETVGNYDKVRFFDENNSIELAEYMKLAFTEKNVFEKSIYNIKNKKVFTTWEKILSSFSLEGEK